MSPAPPAVRALLARPGLRALRRRARILRQTGRWRPDHIRLAASGHLIYVDPTEPRGWRIVHGLGRGHQPAVIDVWRRALHVLEPEAAVDVGANYGEILLSGRYPTCRRVLAVEANPHLIPLLRRSVAAHPDGSVIEVHAVLASDTDGGRSVLHVDPAWSGSASVALDTTLADDALVAIEVPVRTIDSLWAAPAPRRLLFKVDAEGWEAHVLAGMAGLLGGAEEVVGIMEFDPGHLTRAGSDPAETFSTIRALGATWAIAPDGSIRAAATPPDGVADLLVASHPVRAAAWGLPPA